jgi:hypothetical protein
MSTNMPASELLTIKDYLPLVGVVVGGILAIAGGFVSNLWLESRRERRLHRTLALAFQGEIGALLEIVDKRGYIEGLRNARAKTEETGTTHAYHFRARKKYFSVFEANVRQIGLLQPPLPHRVARFYTQANAVLEDMERFEEVDPKEVDPQLAIAAYDELIALFEDAVAVGKQIVSVVSRRYQ